MNSKPSEKIKKVDSFLNKILKFMLVWIGWPLVVIFALLFAIANYDPSPSAKGQSVIEQSAVEQQLNDANLPLASEIDMLIEDLEWAAKQASKSCSHYGEVVQIVMELHQEGADKAIVKAILPASDEGMIDDVFEYPVPKGENQRHELAKLVRRGYEGLCEKGL